MNDIIYVLNRLNDNIAKIGSTKYLKNRMNHYKTCYEEFNDTTHELYIFTFNNQILSCYEMDEYIQRSADKYRNPYIKYIGSGGKEFYYYTTINKLDDLFKKLNFVYTLEKINLNNILTNDAIDYEIEHDENTKKRNVNIEFIEKLLNENNENNENDDKIILKEWQQQMSIQISESESGVIIAPTGSGKTLMLRFEAIKSKNDVLIVTKRKEIFDNAMTYFDDMKKRMYNCGYITNANIEVIDCINNSYNYKIFNNTTKNKKIYIINSDKFIASPKYNNYENYSFGKIKLLIHDECHWSGGEQLYKFLKYMKNNIVDKLIGFSATPMRLEGENRKHTIDIYGKNGKLNVIYQRGYIESINDHDILQIKYKTFYVNKSDLKIVKNKHYTRIYYELDDSGKYKLMNYVDNMISKLYYKKGIIWFKNIKSLKNFYEYVNIYKEKFDNLKNIKIIRTYSENKNEYEEIEEIEEIKDMNKQINIFKNEKRNAILLAVFRATEGYDDKNIEFGIRSYIAVDIDPILEIQRIGRVMRINENKEFGYFINMTIKDDDEVVKKIIKLYSDIVKYLIEYGGHEKMYTKGSCSENNTITIIENFFEFDEKDTHEFNMRNEIMKITFDNPIKEIKKHLNQINKIRYDNGLEMINTKNKLKVYMEKEQFDEFEVKDRNIVKFCLGSKLFDIIKSKYCYDMEEFKNICNKLEISTIEDYEQKYNKNNRLPPYEYIESGFYMELTKGLNILEYFNDHCDNIDN